MPAPRANLAVPGFLFLLAIIGEIYFMADTFGANSLTTMLENPVVLAHLVSAVLLGFLALLINNQGGCLRDFLALLAVAYVANTLYWGATGLTEYLLHPQRYVDDMVSCCHLLAMLLATFLGVRSLA